MVLIPINVSYSTNDIDEMQIKQYVREEVEMQLERTSEDFISGLENKNDKLISYSTVVLSIIGFAVAVWAALSIINALSYKTIRDLEKQMKEIDLNFKKEINGYKKYIKKSELQENKIVELSIYALPIIPRKLFIYILEDRLGKFIANEEIDDIIINMTPGIYKLEPYKEKITSGELRKNAINNLSNYFEFLNIVNTENGYVFDIKNNEYRYKYINITNKILKNK